MAEKTYQESQAELAALSAASVLAAYEQSPNAFTSLAALLVARFNLRAAALADFALARVLGALTLGLGRPDDEVERLTRSFATLAERIAEDGPETARAKVERLAKSEPLDSGREAFSEAMEAHEVEGWTRRTDANPCELCRALADGSVIPTDRRMKSHPNCGCVQVPVERVEEDEPETESFERVFSTGHGTHKVVYREITVTVPASAVI